MNKHKFTSGEWINGWGYGLTGPTCPWQPTVDDNRAYIPISVGKSAIAIVVQPESNSLDEMKANAKLICNAPLLLDALFEAIDQLESWNPESEDTFTMKRIRETIQKATS
jgi:hypothetical protein